MRKTGQCKNCGNAQNPNGNVFKVMKTTDFMFADCLRFKDIEITTEFVKVCQNCNYPNKYKKRKSAKAEKKEKIIDWLLQL